MLNDMIMNYALGFLADTYEDVVVISSLNTGKFIMPDKRISKTRLAVFPLNCDNLHWCVICVLLQEPSGFEAHLYDPLGVEGQVKRSWEKWCGPFIQKWAERDAVVHATVVDLSSEPGSDPQVPRSVSTHHVLTPVQSDTKSCGLYCMQAYAYISGRLDLQRLKTLDAFQVSLARLRLLWYRLCKSHHHFDVKKRQDAERVTQDFAVFKEKQKPSARGGKKINIAVTGKSATKQKKASSQAQDAKKELGVVVTYPTEPKDTASASGKGTPKPTRKSARLVVTKTLKTSKTKKTKPAPRK